MKVQVKFVGLPVPAGIDGNMVELEVDRGTVEEAVVQLIRRYGAGVSDLLLDSDGKLDDYIVVAVNDTILDDRQELGQYRLTEGDRLLFILPAGGG